MVRPVLHGNGFIQLAIGPSVRLHVWSPLLPPAQAVNTPIHDHTFSFASTVLQGSLLHTTYDLGNNSNYGDPVKLLHVAPVPDTEDTILEDTGERLFVGRDRDLVVPAGRSYSFDAGLFHSSDGIGPLTATIMVKTAMKMTPSARVLCPVDKEPDNEFSRYVDDEDMLWRFIRTVDPVWERIFRE